MSLKAQHQAQYLVPHLMLREVSFRRKNEGIRN